METMRLVWSFWLTIWDMFQTFTDFLMSPVNNPLLTFIKSILEAVLPIIENLFGEHGKELIMNIINMPQMTYFDLAIMLGCYFIIMFSAILFLVKVIAEIVDIFL